MNSKIRRCRDRWYVYHFEAKDYFILGIESYTYHLSRIKKGLMIFGQNLRIIAIVDNVCVFGGLNI